MDFLFVYIGMLGRAAEERLAAATEYEDRKFADRDTGQRCREHGARLAHMVVESLGGWGGEAQKAGQVLGRALSTATATPHGTVVV